MLAHAPALSLVACACSSLRWPLSLQVELMEVVDFFRKPEKFRASGARPPKGVLLVGPPGVWCSS